MSGKREAREGKTSRRHSQAKQGSAEPSSTAHKTSCSFIILLSERNTADHAQSRTCEHGWHCSRKRPNPLIRCPLAEMSRHNQSEVHASETHTVLTVSYKSQSLLYIVMSSPSLGSLPVHMNKAETEPNNTYLWILFSSRKDFRSSSGISASLASSTPLKGIMMAPGSCSSIHSFILGSL